MRGNDCMGFSSTRGIGHPNGSTPRRVNVSGVVMPARTPVERGKWAGNSPMPPDQPNSSPRKMLPR
jgi:hypothetical protein